MMLDLQFVVIVPAFLVRQEVLPKHWRRMKKKYS